MLIERAPLLPPATSNTGKAELSFSASSPLGETGVLLRLCGRGTERAVPGRPHVRTDGPEVLAARLITAVSAARMGCHEIVIELGETVRRGDGEVDVRRSDAGDTVVLKGDFTIGRYTIENPTVHFVDIGRSTGNVGAAVLSQFAITIDPANRRLRLAGPRCGRWP